MPEAKTPRLPKIGEYVRGIGKLVEIQDVTPPAPPREIDYVFEVITAHCEVRLGKQVLNSFNSVWDFSGEASSVADSILAAKKFVEQHSILPESDLEVVAVRRVALVRKRPDADNYPNMYAPEFIKLEMLDHGCGRGLPESKETVVWSSRQP